MSKVKSYKRRSSKGKITVVSSHARKNIERRLKQLDKNYVLHSKLTTEHNKLSEKHSILIQKANNEFAKLVPLKGAPHAKKIVTKKYSVKLKEHERRIKQIRKQKAKYPTDIWLIK